MRKSRLRSILRSLGGCAIVLGLLLPLVLVAGGPSDPLGDYRSPRHGARASAVVAEATRTGPVVAGIRVRHAGQPPGAAPAVLSDYGLGVPGWRSPFKEGDTLEIAYLTSNPNSAVVPAALLDEVPGAPEPGYLVPLGMFLAYVGSGIALLVTSLRTPEERMQSWMPPPPLKGEPKPPPSPRAGAVGYKIAAGAIAMLLLPLLLWGLPAYVRITQDALASTGWPQAAGTILQSRVGTQTTTSKRGGQSSSYVPEVTARYDVGGRSWRTGTVRFNYLESGSEADAAAVVGRYKAGASVPVHYDPSNPGRAVLEPGPVMPDAALYGAGAAAAALSWLGALWLLLRRLPPGPEPATSPLMGRHGARGA